ncbi:hypothetical protein BpHYR1_048948 [Brachionus plicatilis]|uniref:Uncharacterized protein n=1 Tax=Brachionus plicatilis TaxID=10195 RepID=A0A3M7QV85_BRAPC|nr:hypothetical protein BpHYR1_048948 [Brachionus plicatilis]
MEYNSDKKPLHKYTKMKGMTAVIGIRLVLPLMVCVFRKWKMVAVCLVSEKRPTFNTVYRKTSTIPIESLLRRTLRKRRI